MNMSNKKYRFMSIDHSNVYRGLAALLILFHHIGCVYGIRALTPLGGLGVATFLVSSGFGLNESFKKSGCDAYKYWSTKIARVILPYLLICEIVAVVGVVAPIIGNPNWYNWYLFYLLKCYVVFFGMAKIPILYKHRYLCLGIMAFVVVVFSNELEAEQGLSFLIGIWISDNKEKSEKFFNNYAIIFGLFAMGGIFLAAKQTGFVRDFMGTPFYCLVQMGIKLPLGLALIAITYKFSWIFFHKIIEFYGKASYEIYLVQAQAFWILDDNLISLVPFLLFVGFFTWLFYVLDEKMKRAVLNLVKR